MTKKKKIAVIGSGIAGLSVAYFLKDSCEVAVYEKNKVFGGHSRTIAITTGDGKTLEVDTGFIVLNDRTYPKLNQLLQDIGIEIKDTEMSFAISVDDGALEWAGTSLDALFAQRKNLLNLQMLRGVLDIIRFNASAKRFVKKFPHLSLGELIKKMKLKSWFRDYYILPMGGAIWSCSSAAMLDFPAATFVNFFDNHGLLSLRNRPQWHTIKHKSRTYVEALVALIQEKGCLVNNASIQYVDCSSDSVEIKEHDQEAKIYDEVIFACHPTETLDILRSVTSKEKMILEKFSKQKNIAFTHCDFDQMPKQRKCWSSWNYLYKKEKEDHSVAVTYWMNKLQHIDPLAPVFVTLNPVKVIPKEKIYDVHEFYHPVFNEAAIAGQLELNAIQGDRHTWFCGAYLRYGFHEDGVWSATSIFEKMTERKLC